MKKIDSSNQVTGTQTTGVKVDSGVKAGFLSAFYRAIANVMPGPTFGGTTDKFGITSPL